MSSWERGLPNVTLKDILGLSCSRALAASHRVSAVREHEGFQSLVSFLDNCPAQLLAMRSDSPLPSPRDLLCRRALKKLRFAKFADDAGKELVASGSSLPPLLQNLTGCRHLVHPPTPMGQALHAGSDPFRPPGARSSFWSLCCL